MPLNSCNFLEGFGFPNMKLSRLGSKYEMVPIPYCTAILIDKTCIKSLNFAGDAHTYWKTSGALFDMTSHFVAGSRILIILSPPQVNSLLPSGINKQQ